MNTLILRNFVKKLKSSLKIIPLLLIALTVVVNQIPADAMPVNHPKVVSANPANFTPNVNEGAVYKLHQAGKTMFAGGNFKTVTHAGKTVNRSNFLAFNAETGVVSNFAPAFDAPVWGIVSSGADLYVAGEFKNVDGVAMKGVAKFNIATGTLDRTFKSPIVWGKASELAIARNKLIVAGTFPEKILAADLVTGKNTGYINFKVTGSVTKDPNDIKIYRFAINPAGNRLVAIGNFTQFNNKIRHRAVMLNLGNTASSVSDWYYSPLEGNNCLIDNFQQLRDVDFSPDGSYFVIVASGAAAKQDRVGRAICDAAARFNTAVLNPQLPVWMAHTGGDTMHSVAVTNTAVYIQGHFRWLDNPGGVDKPGPGAVSRPGVGAVDPSTGKALPWNPTKQRGVGGKDTLITSKGVWIASDTDIVANEWRKRIAFFPL